MMVAEVKSVGNKYQEHAKEILEESMDMEFVSVHVIGETKEGLIKIRSSMNKDTPAKIGALEIAKLQLFQNWE